MLTRELKRELEEGEGRVPHMYLDTVGKVTVGVGCMLPTVHAAVRLPFVHRKNGRRATKPEIERDYRSVSKQTMGRLARAYARATSLVLPDRAIDGEFNRRLGEMVKQLRRRFAGFDDLPRSVQAALIDMAFNLGTNGLVTKFPSFMAAIREEDYAKAADECHRKGIAERRNRRVEGWLREAARHAAQSRGRE